MKAPSLMKTVLALCLGLFVIVSCQEKEGGSEKYVLASFEDIMTCFKDAEILAQSDKINGNVHRLTFESGKKIYFDDNGFRFCQTGAGWPSITTNIHNQWTVNGRNTEIKLSGTATCVVATYIDNEGIWFRTDDGGFMFFTYGTANDVGAVVIEKCNNSQLKENLTAIISGNTAIVAAEQISSSITTAKPTIAIRGTGMAIGNERFINGESEISIIGTTIKWNGFDGSDQTLEITSDLTPQIPKIHINTKNNAPVDSKEIYVEATFKVDDPFSFYGTSSEMSCTGEIRGRGNTTWGLPKKPYRIKFTDKEEFLGMPKSRHWALLANYSDKTLLRNSTAFRISEATGALCWTPRYRHVEVYLNGKYIGLYMVVETVRGAKERVPMDIAGVDEGTDITGGYLIEVDDRQTNDSKFRTSNKVWMGFKDPDNPTEEQFNYVKGYIQKVENAIYSGNHTDPVNGYRGHIDVESFVANYLVNELTKNIDGNFRLSSFLAKYQGNDKLSVSNVWDFDLAIGNCNYFPEFYSPVTNEYNGFFINDSRTPWYNKLFEDQAFRNDVKAMWNNTLYPQIDKIIEDTRKEAEAMEKAIERNFNEWKILGVYVWPNLYYGGTYDDNLEYMLGFLKQRAEWLNSEINKL